MEDHLQLSILLSTTLRPVAVALDLCEKKQCFVILRYASNVAVRTYSSSLFFFGKHDNGGTLVLPNQPPEVILSVWQRALSGNVCLALVVALCKKRKHYYHTTAIHKYYINSLHPQDWH